MKKLLFLLILSMILSVLTLEGQQINGIIYYHNSGGKRASGVEINAFGCNKVYSKGGMFILPCPGKVAGQEVSLVVGNTDDEGRSIEVVNDHQLEWLRWPDKMDHNPIKIIVCFTGQRDKAALRYYNIMLDNYNADYEHRLKFLESKLKASGLSDDDRKMLMFQMAELKMDREHTLKDFETKAQLIASINQDQASDEIKMAIHNLEREQNLNTSLNLLEEVNLDETYQSEVNIAPELRSKHYSDLGTEYARNNMFPEAKETFKEYEKLFPDNSNVHKNWTTYYTLKNQNSKAINHLQQAVEMGYKDLDWLQSEGSIENLRNEEEFKDIIKKLEEHQKIKSN